MPCSFWRRTCRCWAISRGRASAPFTYNALHILIVPALLALAGSIFGNAMTTAIALIWIIHIAVDRALGYGLKLSSGFQDTHLGRIGR